MYTVLFPIIGTHEVAVHNEEYILTYINQVKQLFYSTLVKYKRPNINKIF